MNIEKELTDLKEELCRLKRIGMEQKFFQLYKETTFGRASTQLLETIKNQVTEKLRKEYTLIRPNPDADFTVWKNGKICPNDELQNKHRTCVEQEEDKVIEFLLNLCMKRK